MTRGLQLGHLIHAERVVQPADMYVEPVFVCPKEV